MIRWCVRFTLRGIGSRLGNLNPNTYGLRLILDRNGNGRWDPGDYSEKIAALNGSTICQKALRIDEKLGIERTFNPLETPLSEQKPKELIQNKPKERKRRDLNARQEEQMRQRGVGGNRGMDQGRLWWHREYGWHGWHTRTIANTKNSHFY